MKCATVKSLAILATVCLGLTSCGHDSSTGTQATASASAASLPQVAVTVVRSKKLKATIGLPAELVPYEAVDLYARETGFVKSIRVDRGSTVKQGELIAEIEAPELVAQRAQANAAYQSSESQLAAGQAKLAADQATFERTSAAAKTPGVVAPNDLEIAEKTAQSDQANVGALRKTADAAQEGLRAVTQLESYLRVTAPFDGQITTRYVHPGTLIGPAAGAGAMTPIVRIETVTRHRLVVPVPENDVAGVPEGTLVNFTVPSFPGKTFSAPIARISHGVDVKTRTMPVELDVRDPRAELVPGTFCEVQWPISRTYATLFVPASGVGGDLERTFVIRVRNGRTEWVDVKTGVRVENSVEVFGDLKEGDQVAIRGTDQLRPGTTVSPSLSD
ncbi:MAG: efflux RND transporter periplasmic adaptor subunit [Candidatus Acidiferrales bacterium]|jgi:membrane fusion protein, multidrug efflux system